jgi:hypothetical protein
MCGEQHGHGEEPGFRGARGFRAPRGFGRRGFPSREEWVERLEAHRERLERDLANVRDLIARLSDEPTGEPAGS